MDKILIIATPLTIRSKRIQSIISDFSRLINMNDPVEIVCLMEPTGFTEMSNIIHEKPFKVSMVENLNDLEDYIARADKLIVDGKFSDLIKNKISAVAAYHSVDIIEI